MLKLQFQYIRRARKGASVHTSVPFSEFRVTSVHTRGRIVLKTTALTKQFQIESVYLGVSTGVSYETHLECLSTCISHDCLRLFRVLAFGNE